MNGVNEVRGLMGVRLRTWGVEEKSGVERRRGVLARLI